MAKKKVELNSRDSGTLDGLKEGNSLLEAILKTKSEVGLVQIRLIEVIKPDHEQSGDLKALFQSMTRADDPKPRHAYIPIGYAELEHFFGIEISELDKWFMNERGREELILNINNPTFIRGENKGKRIRVQINESVYPKDQWQADNWDSQVKKNPSTGQKMMHEGQHVFPNTFVVVGKAKHKWLKNDQMFVPLGTPENPLIIMPKEKQFEDLGWTPPVGKMIPAEGTFEELREQLNI